MLVQHCSGTLHSVICQHRMSPLCARLRCSTPAPQPPCFGRQSQQCSSSAQQQRRLRCAAAAAAPAASAGKLLASSEISAFIPRQDLINQLLRWAYIDGQDQGVANFGLPMTVKPSYREEEQLWGYTVTVHSREGEPLAQLSVRLDEVQTTRHEYMGRGADGFPEPEGGAEEVLGKNLEIRSGNRLPRRSLLRTELHSLTRCQEAAIPLEDTSSLLRWYTQENG